MIQKFFEFIKLIFVKRSLIISLAKRELASQYIGSLFGLFWTFINPLVTIFVFWVIFSVGFKVQPVNDVPFVVWLAAGMAIWFCFTDIINGSTGVVVKYSQLIKKTFFPASILPLVKAVSGLFTHAVFLLVLVGLIIFQGMPFNLYWLQFLYYLWCMLVFALGIGWLLAALQVFVRDTVHFVGVVLQLGFWATPIFWDLNIMPEKLQIIFKLNPMYYVVQGYRESFIYFEPFWHHPVQTLYFWAVALLMLVIGPVVFRSLRPQFADVL